MKKKLTFFIAFLIVVLIACNTDDNYYKVTKVVDGDTFWVDNHTKEGLKVRLIGIDAPESHQSKFKQIQLYGKESKSYVIKLLLNQKVRLEYDIVTKDRYGRTLAYAYLKDGTFVNQNLIENGYARLMTIPPNVKYAPLFVELQQIARENNRGVWKK